MNLRRLASFAVGSPGFLGGEGGFRNLRHRVPDLQRKDRPDGGSSRYLRDKGITWVYVLLFLKNITGPAKIVDFGGWDMPVVYSSIIEEHKATRESAGLFDVSHMGRIWFKGHGAGAFLEHLLTNKISDLAVENARYSLILNLDGGTRDDVLAYRVGDEYLLVVNASNRMKLIEWFEGHLADFDVSMTDATATSAMIAVQGPKAIDQVQPLVDARLDQIGHYGSVVTTLLGASAM